MKIEFETNSAAFCNPQTGEEDREYHNYECRRILNQIKSEIAHSEKESGTILDSNGNPIGHWEF